MRAISPGVGGDERIIGEENLAYAPIPATRCRGRGDLVDSWAMRWRLTEEERERIAAGEDLVVVMPEHIVPYELLLFGDAFEEEEAAGGTA